MAIFRTGTPSSTQAIAALLAVVIVSGSGELSHAQYFYTPAPDYYHNDTAEGTVLGGALGAITGAVVGGKKKRGEGALIGAGVGALTGNLLGRSKDQADQYHAAAGAAAVAQANQQSAAQAVTNYDLIRLTQAGVGEDVIIGTVRARGARLDLSPQGIISLKENGVSDRVLVAAQELTRPYAAAPTAPPRTAVFAEPAPSTVIISPRPRYMYYPPPRYHHHRPRGAGMHFHYRY